MKRPLIKNSPGCSWDVAAAWRATTNKRAKPNENKLENGPDNSVGVTRQIKVVTCRICEKKRSKQTAIKAKLHSSRPRGPISVAVRQMLKEITREISRLTLILDNLI